MSMQKTLGGERLGSGKKQKVELHGYERSTHDMGYIWRSTMSAGTLVPFLSEVALPGDTFDINLDCDIKTHPTIGPLFGSYKVQLDIFQAPIRLYQGQLHNNKLGIGMNMANVKLPTLTLTAVKQPATTPENYDLDNSQINPSCILSYLGIRGIGYVETDATEESYTRTFNAVPFLAYWDIYKQYYANKNEEGLDTEAQIVTRGAVIHTSLPVVPDENVDTIEIQDGPSTGAIPQAPVLDAKTFSFGTVVDLNWTTAAQLEDTVILRTSTGLDYFINDLFYNAVDDGIGTITYSGYRWAQFGDLVIQNWRYISPADQPEIRPQAKFFDLENIDRQREQILAWATQGATPFDINESNNAYIPYSWIRPVGNEHSIRYSQEGLGLKTYQSDLFNNWLNTEWLDGVGGINEITAVDTTGDSFKIEALILAKKVYDMLNRIAVSGGSYDDWLDAVYTHERIQRAESPIYHGGLIRELVFQEVVSNSKDATGEQPLGTLAGKGIMADKRKGGQVTVKVDEPSYIIGIISLTPRLDYSQGNKWDVHLLTMDDLHKPALDQIGFQELITEQMAWWSTQNDGTASPGVWNTRSAGKQPAWINYMTNVNQTRGNFAIENNEMFMTLNRKYQKSIGNQSTIDDLTTYIDPAKYNDIFAQTAIDSQNYWAQIAVDITARRKMSAKVMPNL